MLHSCVNLYAQGFADAPSSDEMSRLYTAFPSLHSLTLTSVGASLANLHLIPALEVGLFGTLSPTEPHSSCPCRDGLG